MAVAGASPAQAGTVPGGTHQAPSHARPVPVGPAWGANVDAQIQQAIRVDDGNQTAFADSWLAWGIAQRSAQGWRDKAAAHYLAAALDQPNPYGLTYAYDAFQNGTTNPASTVYTITLPQVGQVVLDAYEHGQAPYAQITASVDRVLAQPRIKVAPAPGIGLAYSNAVADVRMGYSVHNVNQYVALFLQDLLDAGVTYRATETRALIGQLNAFELASYNPALNGWTYRNGGSTAVQDPAHSGVGVLWGQRFYPASIGRPNVAYVMATDYGYAFGSGVHASLAQYACSDSRRWLPQYAQYMADPRFQDFASAAKATPAMAQSATACGAPQPTGAFSVKSKAALRATHIKAAHVAPDNLRR